MADLDEESFVDKNDDSGNNETYENKKLSKTEFAHKWNQRVEAADRVYKAWADRFRVEMLYQYYEGFQWFFETDENNRPYVINMMYATIETKLPNLIFENPQFSAAARPIGTSFNEESANESAQRREDALNFICNLKEIGISDKHELAVLDAFFGFGVIESGYSDELVMNPNISLGTDDGPYACMYVKQIPFDTFRASATANWDLSVGKWYGYYEFIPYSRLEKYHDVLKYPDKPYDDSDEVATVDASSGKITVATESNNVIGPAGTCKIWKIWDFERGKFLMLAPDDATAGDQLLEYKDFDFGPLSFLRFTKRRKGWYPYPPVWNWISPQDELNDTRQAQRLHRKRFSRKYTVITTRLENEEELDKFLYGPDGTIIKATQDNAITPIADAPLDPVSPEALGITYDDFNRVSGTTDERRGFQASQSGNRTTATQANIVNQQSAVRDSKDSLNVANFLCDVAKNILKSLRYCKKKFWISTKLNPLQDGPMMELQPNKVKWSQVSTKDFKDLDYDIDLNVTSVSPISTQKNKNAFMEFLAIITQYEILAFSPALLREAAYQVGYKNEAVLNQFQQMAQLAALGRMAQLKQSVSNIGTQGQQPTPPGQMPQQQTAASTPPDNESIMNTIFNRGPAGQ